MTFLPEITNAVVPPPWMVAQLTESGITRDHTLTMVLDLETYGRWADLPSSIQSRLKSRAKDGEKPEESCALSAMTGKIIMMGLGLYCSTFETQTAWFERPEKAQDALELVTLPETTAWADEHAMLLAFWSLLNLNISTRPIRIVTFNGRGFDIPFLLHRSAILGIHTIPGLLGDRPERFEMIDLAAILTCNDAVKRPSLELACHAFGIPTPKTDLTGAGVGAAYERGEIVRIARYCLCDVVATRTLEILLRRANLIPEWSER